ncbi:hypothetical protein CEP51_016807 [Fusarium floridanum]|uniref:Uncharacterized protein n=1 Tax=Fusarium floridanum TaxID=1325733 RepID=A0A428NFC5_9HYPO|nr:hypothetical protein CEP51_016807 [Fusarium floridanum]
MVALGLSRSIPEQYNLDDKKKALVKRQIISCSGHLSGRKPPKAVVVEPSQLPGGRRKAPFPLVILFSLVFGCAMEDPANLHGSQLGKDWVTISISGYPVDPLSDVQHSLSAPSTAKGLDSTTMKEPPPLSMKHS